MKNYEVYQKRRATKHISIKEFIMQRNYSWQEVTILSLASFIAGVIVMQIK